LAFKKKNFGPRGITLLTLLVGPLCQPLCLWRRRRARKLAPLGRLQAAASAGQPSPPPLPVDQKDRLRQAARGSTAERPRRQPEHNSTAACASAERHASKSTAARRRALPAGAATPGRAQQHGGMRFYRAPPRQPDRNSTAACASAGRCSGQGTTTRRRALLQSATTPARA
jgi:hypothetical protein